MCLVCYAAVAAAKYDCGLFLLPLLATLAWPICALPLRLTTSSSTTKMTLGINVLVTFYMALLPGSLLRTTMLAKNQFHHINPQATGLSLNGVVPALRQVSALQGNAQGICKLSLPPPVASCLVCVLLPCVLVPGDLSKR